MASDHLTDLEIDQLYTTGQLGNSSPDSLINTLWFNNTIHFGIRGGGSEHRKLKWGDIVLGYDNDMNSEFLEYKERQTKTRTGENITNVRRQHPRLYATSSDRCPVLTYKAYANHRPENFSGPDHPFYLAVVTHSKLPAKNDQWFLRAPIGRNKLSSLMKVMSQKAGLPDMQSGKRITNTSVRKTLCQKLLQANVPDTQAVLITGHKNPASLNNYRILSNVQQKAISNLISSSSDQALSAQVPPSSNSVLRELSQSNTVSNSNMHQVNIVAHNVPSFCLFSNTTITGGTFNINVQFADKK